VEYVAGNQKGKNLDFSMPYKPLLIMFDGGYICQECHSESAREQAKDRSLDIENPFPEYMWARKVEFDRKREATTEARKKYLRTFHS